MTKPKQPTTPKTLGKRILQARREIYGMSQDELAQNLGITRAAISQYEKDKHTPRREKIELLTEVFNTGPDWFEHGRGRPPAPLDVPLDIPEIAPDRVTSDVMDLRSLRTGRRWRLPIAAFEGGLAVKPDHIVAMVAPANVAPVHAGDRVVIDLDRKVGPPGVFLVIDGQKSVSLRWMHGHPDGSDVCGRVVAFFRTV